MMNEYAGTISGKMVFGNGTELKVLCVMPGMEYLDNVNRPSVVLHFPVGERSLDEMHDLVSDSAATGTMKLVNQQTGTEGSVVEQIFEGFTLKVKLSVEPFMGPMDENGVAATQERIVVVLARKSVQEQQQEKILAELAKLGITL